MNDVFIAAYAVVNGGFTIHPYPTTYLICTRMVANLKHCKCGINSQYT